MADEPTGQCFACRKTGIPLWEMGTMKPHRDNLGKLCAGTGKEPLPTVPSVPVDADTARPTLLDVVRVLQATYTDTGVLIWLNATNKAWPMTGFAKVRTIALQGLPFYSPRQMINAGRIAEVLEVAQQLENGGG